MLITITEFKLFNKINTADTNLDYFIQQIIGYAQRQAEDYINYKLDKQIHTEIIDGNGESVIYPKNIPLLEVNNISKYDYNTDNYVSLQKNIDYTRLVFDDISIVLEGGVFEKGFKNYKIEYIAGYDDVSVPANIKLGLLELATIYFNESKQGEGNLLLNSKNKSQAGIGESYDKEIEQKILAYRFGKYVKANI